MVDPFLGGDIQIVESLKKGNKNGIEFLLRKYGKAIVSIATKKHGLSFEDAEELMSDIIMEIAKKIDTFDQSKGSLHAWIGSIAHRRAIDHFRKMEKKLIEQTMSDDWWLFVGQSDDPLDHESDQSLDATGKASIESIMSHLNDREQALLKLRAENHSLDDIANMLNMEKNAVSVAHYRAKQHFIKLWGTTEIVNVRGSVGA